MTDFKFDCGLWNVTITCEKKDKAIEKISELAPNFNLISEEKAV